ncbi:hypothetical protein BG262_04455 [Floricoccus penangensis]|uniref:DUF5067 domain-containing protein n=1 Tax=Floricoccus penangensis TaxID=1859475 RepID=A0A9Q5JFB9_9LACT|nr:hypothetical protein [Floricoccus penangensis]OFI46273.1 hypothetical protein BG262_04455 [Floricoccus penangensis]
MNKNKLFVLGLLLTFATTTACSKKVEEKSSNGNNLQKIERKSSETSSSTTKEIKKTSESSKGTDIKKDSSEVVLSEEEQKGINFNNLPIKIQVHLIATISDSRAESDLQGYQLAYNIDGDDLYLQVHSGVGNSHPILHFVTENNTIYPKGGTIGDGPLKIKKFEVDETPITKAQLYDKYTLNKSIYDSGLDKINEQTGENNMVNYFYANEKRLELIDGENLLMRLIGTWESSKGGKIFIKSGTGEYSSLLIVIQENAVSGFAINTATYNPISENVIFTEATDTRLPDGEINCKVIFKDDNNFEIILKDNNSDFYNSNTWVENDQITTFKRIE